MKGLRDKVEIVAADTNPGDNVEINSTNPLGKIPALIVDGKTAIFDSHVICEYLDSLAPAPVLFPKSGPERWKTLVLGSLADGILDAALLLVYEKRFRPEDKWHAGWQQRQQAKIDRALDQLEKSPPAWGQSPDYGHLTLACRARLSRFPARGQMARRAPEAGGLARPVRASACRPSRRRGRRPEPEEATMLRATESLPAGVLEGQARRRRPARLRPAHAAAHRAHRRGRARVPARPGARHPCCVPATPSGSRTAASSPSKRAGDAARDHLPDALAAGAHRLASRQPAPRHRDRRARHPHPRRPRHRRHGARPGRPHARSSSAPSTPKAAPTARAPCRATVTAIPPCARPPPRSRWRP